MSDDGRLPTDDAPPEGWVWMTLGDVVEQRAEQILPSQFPDHPFNYLALENIEQGTGRIINFEPIPAESRRS
jgi:hypothetical protein